jgi:hypothetical protein
MYRIGVIPRLGLADEGLLFGFDHLLVGQRDDGLAARVRIVADQMRNHRPTDRHHQDG